MPMSSTVRAGMFDATAKRRTVMLYDALNGTAFNLGQPTFTTDDEIGMQIVFTSGDERNRARAIYRNIATDGFTWQGDFSADGGATWHVAAMVIDCRRAGVTSP